MRSSTGSSGTLVKKLGIFLVIHMDPVETKDAQVLALQKQVTEILDAVDHEGEHP